jgi:hypothetical protein
MLLLGYAVSVIPIAVIALYVPSIVSVVVCMVTKVV